MITLAQESGGLGSAYMLKVLLDRQDTDVHAIFADVKGSGASHFWSDLTSIELLLHERFGGESRDTYRFLWQISNALNVPIERLEDGRSTWAVFGQTRSFRLRASNNRYLCKASDLLKREVIARYIEQTYTPGTFQIALGMSALEGHRLPPAQHWWRERLGWPVKVYAPLIDLYTEQRLAVDNVYIINWLNSLSIDPPAAYAKGYPHNNCNAQCVQGGQSSYAILYRTDPEAYLYAAWQEYRIRTLLGVGFTILRLVRKGESIPITLYDFISLIENGEINERDAGTCACITYEPMVAFLAQVPIEFENQ